MRQTNHRLLPTTFRRIDVRPVDPSTIGGHISVDRWYQGSGDGWEALRVIFNEDNNLFGILGLYLLDNREAYKAIYGD